MKLFLKILLWSALVIAIIAGGIWAWIAAANRSGPEAPALASLSQHDFQTVIDGVRAERRLVGLVARVDIGGETIVEAASGFHTKDKLEPITGSELFHVGSIGKSMSATTIATIVEDRLLSWDSTLGDVLPDLQIDEGWKAVTLWQLLTHTSGVPRPGMSHIFTATSNADSPDYPDALTAERRTIAENLLAERPSAPPGSDFSYSNMGYTLASLMASTATEMRWEDLIQTRLAEPLGLETLGFRAPPPGNPSGHRLMAGYKLSFAPETNSDNPNFMAAAGTMHISLDDLMDYARAHMDAGQSDGALLSEETFQKLHTPNLDSYAGGWIIQSEDFGDGQEPFIWHNGSNTMWYALLVMMPERDAAIAIVTNDGSGIDVTRGRFSELAKEIGAEVAAR